MTTVPIQAPDWRKSSRSDGQDTCVEVRRDLAALRDSKCLAAPALLVDAAALVAAVKSGRVGR